MKKISLLSIIFILIIIIFFSGCIGETSNDGSSNTIITKKANLQITDWTGAGHWDVIKGYYATINFVIQNSGTATSSSGSVRLYCTDQNNEVEADRTQYLPNLSPGEVHGLSYEVDYEMGDTLLNTKITVSWTGGSNQYSDVIYL